MANSYTVGSESDVTQSEIDLIEELTGKLFQDLTDEEVRAYLEFINRDTSGYTL